VASLRSWLALGVLTRADIALSFFPLPALSFSGRASLPLLSVPFLFKRRGKAGSFHKAEMTTQFPATLKSIPDPNLRPLLGVRGIMRDAAKFTASSVSVHDALLHRAPAGP